MAQTLARPKIPAAPSRHLYDVIVVGGQLGAPLAGAVLAKRGYRVLYVEHDGQGPGYEHEGQLLPYAPFVAPPLKSMPVVEETLKELGLNTQIQRSLRPQELQLVFQNGTRHRLELASDPKRRRAELVREFGEEGGRAFEELERFGPQHETSDAFVKGAADLPPSGLFSTLRAKKQVASHPEITRTAGLSEDVAATALLRRLLPFVSWLDAPDQPLARTRPLAQVLHAPCRYPGGRDGLRELLVKKLEDLGGHVLSRASDAHIVEQLTFDGGKLVGLQVLQSANVYRGAVVVAATDAGALRRLIPDKKKHRELAEALDLVETKQYLFAVNWVVPEQVMPLGMGELLLVDTGDTLETLLVQVHNARSPGGEERPGEKVICAAAFVPASTRELGEARLLELKKQIEGHLEALMPFVRPKLILSSAPYLDAGGVRGSRLLPHPLLRLDTERYAGITGLSPRTPVKNLVLASREVLPGLGLEGELMAGIRAASVVHEQLHKKKPL